MKKKIGAIFVVLVLAMVLAVSMAMPVAAAKPTKPPTGLHWDVNFVTQLAYNQPLFNDTFDSGLSQWTQISGTWAIADDSGNNMCSITGGSYVGGVVATAGSSSWTDYSLEFDVKKVSGNYFNVVFRYTDANNHYLLEPSSDSIHIALFKKVGGSYQELTSPRPLQNTTQGNWYHYKIVAQGPSIKVYVDGTLKIDVTDNSLPAGKIGIGAYSGATAYFDDVQVMGVDPNQILIPLNGTGGVTWTFGDDFRIVDNDANVNDGDAAIVQFPWGMNGYSWWLSARGKPGLMGVSNFIIPDGHAQQFRSTGSPTWWIWPGCPYTWEYLAPLNHTASLANYGVANLGLRVYPNQP